MVKVLADRPRIIASLVLPFFLVVLLGRSFQSGLGDALGYDYLRFVFTGVFAQTLFQSSALGLVSLAEDRDTDFAQELFVAPVSRYSIVFGKVLGESTVALVQGVGIVAFGVLVGVHLDLSLVTGMAVAALPVCLFGGAFGVLILSFAQTRRFTEQLFNFVFLPQFLLAGVFNPVDALPGWLSVIAHIAPMRYAVDLTRGLAYAGDGDRAKVVLDPFALDVAVVAVLATAFLVVGTVLFVRRERRR
jgi:ABC-2 type transport system permease protein